MKQLPPDGPSTELSRRVFLCAATFAAATAAYASPSLPRAEAELAPLAKEPPDLPVPGPAKPKTGWAVVGLGALALEEIVPAFKECESSHLVALVSGHPEKAKRVSDYYGVSQKNIYTYDTFDSIRENPDIDVVYIALPNSMHAEYTIRALKAGKHVLCEKPMATTADEARQMVIASADAGKHLMIAYRLRHEPFNQKMIEFARAKTFGTIKSISAENVQVVKAPNIRLSRALGGGPLGDVGIYCLNACRYLTGEEPLSVTAMNTRPSDDPRFAEVDDRIAFLLKFPSGIVASCVAGFSAAESRRYRVHAENGWFGLDPAFSYRGLRAETGTNNGREQLKIREVNHFAAEMDHLSRCVQTGTRPITPGEEGLRDMIVMECILRSAQDKQEITVPSEPRATI